jgi:hypothetical protein|tara:strand:- start:6277 stop:6726 length:450 start_codon:yes stop_codon:yes gene_type:complete
MENKTDKLLEALEAAKKEFKPLAKNGKNNFFKTQNGVHEYSTLVDIKNATEEALNAHGLSLYYTITFENDLHFLTTNLVHTGTGQFIQSKSVIGGATNTPQQNGSGITYYRRYHIQAMLNLEADFDDDGNKASNVEKKEEKKQPIKGGL